MLFYGHLLSKACRCATSACFASSHFISCMYPLHGFPFLFILPSFYLSQLYVQVAIPSDHLSIIASLLAQPSHPRMVWSLTPGWYKVDIPGLAVGVTDGALGREGKPKLNQQATPPASIVNSIYINRAVAPHQLRMFLCNKMHWKLASKTYYGGDN